VVFEPNREITWAGVRLHISDRLACVWRDEVVAETTSNDAFLGRCDRSTINANRWRRTRMPYLEAPWVIPPEQALAPSFSRRVASGVWVPEHDLLGWSERHVNLPLSDVWLRRSESMTAESMEAGLAELKKLPLTVKEEYLYCLGRDIGSNHRDGFLYRNLLEQLKPGPLRTPPPTQW
jgi:hypothetical protein